MFTPVTDLPEVIPSHPKERLAYAEKNAIAKKAFPIHPTTLEIINLIRKGETP